MSSIKERNELSIKLRIIRSMLQEYEKNERPLSYKIVREWIANVEKIFVNKK